MPESAARLLDRFEQAVALALYIFLVRRIWPKHVDFGDLSQTLVLLSEGAIIIFLIIRKPTAGISARPLDWAAAFVATIAPLLIVGTDHPFMPTLGVVLMLFGMIVQVGAKFSLNRSFGLIASNRGVKTQGAYRYVRHPMYLGYMISHVGFLLIAPAPLNIALYALCWALFVLRINMEERILSEDAAYQAFSARVRYRLLPGLY